MKYLINTDALIYCSKGDKKIAEFLAEVDYYVSIISIGELYYAIHNSDYIEENLHALNSIAEKLEILYLTLPVISKFGALKSNLKSKGEIIEDIDLLIGATAIVNNMTLLTTRTDYFSRLPSLKVFNWLEDEDDEVA